MSSKSIEINRSRRVESQRSREDILDNNLTKRIGVAALLAAGIMVAGTIAFNAAVGGATEYKPQPEKLSAGIESIHLDSGAHIRSEASVPNEYDNDNLVMDLESPIDIPNNGNIEVKSNVDGNGDWYGVPVEQIEQSTDTQIKDKDGIVWVNQQKAHPNQ